MDGRRNAGGIDATAARTIHAFWIAAYGIVLLLLAGVKPFWLDEVIQLSGTSGTGWQGMIREVLRNAGAAPLGYLVQQRLISAAGLGMRIARLPSVFSGVGTLVALLWICKKLALPPAARALTALLWMVCPLALRYSLEGRPYMQALLFAMLAAGAQIRLQETRQAAWALGLAACLSAAVYSQPFAVFAPLGFAACSVWRSRDPKYTKLTCGAYALAALSFLPWFAAARTHWATPVHGGGMSGLTASLRVLLRECMGDGYFAAIPAILLAAYGARRLASRLRSDWRAPVLAAILSGIGCVLLAEARFGYFFAIRQVVFILPFFLAIAADGAASLWGRRWGRCAAAALVLVFLAASALKDYRYLTDRSEDWERLSGILNRAAEGGCILIPGGDDAAKYTLLQPMIARRICPAVLPARVVMPVHPYTDPRTLGAARSQLSAMGMTRLSTEEAGFARVEVFGRR